MRGITAEDFTLDSIVLDGDCIFDPGTFVRAGRKTRPAIVVSGNGITIDFNGAVLDGGNFRGYGLYLRDCHDVTIRNADIRGYFYGVCAERCSGITIEDCVISGNYDNKDAGWLHETFKGDVRGLGGGILLKRTDHSLVQRCTLTGQFNGLDLIFCDAITVLDNDCSRNSNFGLHLLKTHRSLVIGNSMDECIRYLPNRHDEKGGCDSAGILMEESSHYNRFLRNTFRHSGDGVYVRANNLKRSNHNYFGYNDGSFSPHNAFEDGFGIGNVYECNIASHSDYGFWVFDNYGAVLRGNTVVGNAHDGIAMMYGRGNLLAENLVMENGGAGVRMWWQEHETLHNEPSSDHVLRQNVVRGNGKGVAMAKSERITLQANDISSNGEDVVQSECAGVRVV